MTDTMIPATIMLVGDRRIDFDDEPSTDNYNVGHDFSDGSRMFVPNAGNICSCFYNI